MFWILHAIASLLHQGHTEGGKANDATFDEVRTRQLLAEAELRRDENAGLVSRSKSRKKARNARLKRQAEREASVAGMSTFLPYLIAAAILFMLMVFCVGFTLLVAISQK